MIYDRSEQHIAEELRVQIENELSRIGLLFRVFSRAKSRESIVSKLQRKEYGSDSNSKKMQDLYGVRIALYFPDDGELSQRALKSMFRWDERSSTIDMPSDATFGPTRCNLIFRLPENLAKQSTILKQELRIDSTFETQFRTVFSEGWHEVEHDLRYKCKSDWEPHQDLNRAMNGFIATLETCDWAMIKLFEELAWRHYKAKEWSAMIKTKFRLRWQDTNIDHDMMSLLNEDGDLAKKIYRINRSSLMAKIFESKIDLPITLSNLIYIANHFFIGSDGLKKITPAPVIDELEYLRSENRVRER